MENRIESFSELEAAVKDNMDLSNEISATLNETNSIYDDQKLGWASANSTNQINKMMDYAAEAQKISKNAFEVNDAIQGFKTATQNIDEQA